MKKTGFILFFLAVICLTGEIAMAANEKKQTAGRDILGTAAPKFAELNDDVLFGEVWSRTDELSLRDRSMLTVASLMTKGIFDSSLKSHIQNARKNGIKQEEMAEILTHLAFYSGWPNAWAAFRIMKEVYSDPKVPEPAISKEEFDKMNTFGQGTENTKYAEYFTGKSYLNPLTPQDAILPVTNVTFEPGCRNNWHIHKATKGGGQTLICIAGEGYYQEFGKEVVLLKPGMVITIPANVKHWHGATKNSWFSHLSISVPGEEVSTEWLEPVTDKHYNKLK